MTISVASPTRTHIPIPPPPQYLGFQIHTQGQEELPNVYSLAEASVNIRKHKWTHRW